MFSTNSLSSETLCIQPFVSCLLYCGRNFPCWWVFWYHLEQWLVHSSVNKLSCELLKKILVLFLFLFLYVGRKFIGKGRERRDRKRETERQWPAFLRETAERVKILFLLFSFLAGYLYVALAVLKLTMWIRLLLSSWIKEHFWPYLFFRTHCFILNCMFMSVCGFMYVQVQASP